MKKLCTIVGVLSLLSFTTFAQSTVRVDGGGSGNLAYEKGDKIFLAGISFGYYGYGLVSTRSVSLPPLTAALELGIHESISVGPYVGYASWDYRNLGFNYGWDFLAVGGRGSFHYVPLLNEALDLNLDEEKLDFYLTLLVGLEFQTYNGPDGVLSSANNTRFVLGPVLGFKYKFNPRFGAYFEGGRGAFGYGTVGVAIHF
ncbi:MAG: hypothetical protein ACFB15_11475 [Cyclobacteriaceae bacterium]